MRPVAMMQRHPALPTYACRAGVGAVLALMAVAGSAETTPYLLGASAGVARDSNLLRLADGQPAPAGYRRGDTAHTATLLARLDQPFGRQRVSADLSLRDTRYAANAIYDNLGYTAQAGLDWSTAGRVSGTLAASANRELYSFNIGYDAGLVEQRNLQDTRNANASVAVGLVTQWSATAHVGWSSTGNSLDDARVQALNFDQEKAGFGLRWRPSSAVAWNLGLERARGRYPNYRQLAGGEFAADRFRQTSLELGLSVQPSGASQLALQLGRTATRYDLNQLRDFTGTTGRLVWNWQPTGKLRLSSKLSRGTGQDAYEVTVFGSPGTSDYSRVVDTLRVEADHELSAKVKLTASWQTVRRTVVNTVENPFIPLSAQGKDTTDDLALGVRWTAQRSLALGCDFGSLRRRTQGPLASPLHSESFACFGQFLMQP
jgi:hypothetical protein